MAGNWWETDIVAAPAATPAPSQIAPVSPLETKAESPDSAHDWWESDVPVSGASAVTNYAPDKSADVLTNMAAGTMFPEQQVLYYASKRFPSEPLEKSVKRYRVKDGEVSYKSRDGQWYRESAGWDDAAAKSLTATGVPMVGGLLGSLVGAPAGGVPGMLAGGAGGAAIADAGKRAVGDFLAPEASTAMQKLMSATGEGLLDVAGGAAGALIVKGVKSLPLKELQKHLGGGADRLMEVARDKFGIELTWAEASNLKSLLGRQQMLNRSGDAADFLHDKYLNRMGEIRGAVDDFLNVVSPTGSSVEAANMAIDASEGAVRRLQREIQREMAPKYAAAYAAHTQPLDLSDVATMAADKAKVLAGDAQASMKQVLDIIGDRSTVEEVHNARMAVDELMGRAAKGEVPGWNSRNMHHLGEVRAAIDAKLKAIDEFRTADAAYSSRIGDLEALGKSVVGDIARARKPDIARIGNALFNTKGIDIKAFRAAKARIMAENPDAWDSIVRWHMANSFDQVSRGSRPGEVRDLGGRFVSAIYGDGKQSELMREAVSHHPAVRQTLETLAEVLTATSRGIKEGSPTQPLQEQSKQAAKEAMSSSPAMMATGLGRYISPDMLPALSSRINDIAAGRYNRQFAEALFLPDFQQAMKYIQLVGPKTRTGIQASTRYLMHFIDDLVGATEELRSSATSAGQQQTPASRPPQAPGIPRQ